MLSVLKMLNTLAGKFTGFTVFYLFKDSLTISTHPGVLFTLVSQWYIKKFLLVKFVICV